MTLSTFLRVIERAALPWEVTPRKEIRLRVRLGTQSDTLNPLGLVALLCRGRFVPPAQTGCLSTALELDPRLAHRLWAAAENLPSGHALRPALARACGLEGL